MWNRASNASRFCACLQNQWKSTALSKWTMHWTQQQTSNSFYCASLLSIYDTVALLLGSCINYIYVKTHFRPQRPRSFWSAPRIATSGQVQGHLGFEWIYKHNRVRPELIRFVQTWLWACAEWQEVRKSRTSAVGPGQRSRFLVLTKRSAASGNENSEDNEIPLTQNLFKNWTWFKMIVYASQIKS